MENPLFLNALLSDALGLRARMLRLHCAPQEQRLQSKTCLEHQAEGLRVLCDVCLAQDHIAKVATTLTLLHVDSDFHAEEEARRSDAERDAEP